MAIHRIGIALVACLSLLSCLTAAGEGLLPSVRSRLPERAVVRPPGVPDDVALETSGAVIGEVRLVRVNVFDPTIPDENIPLFRFINRIHIVSRESTIATQLLFRPGDRYEASAMRETERRLRSNGYLADALIRPVAYADGKVDVEVVTQDTWTLKPQLGFGRKGGSNTTSVGLEEQNFLGFGSRLAFTYEQNVDRETRTLEYKDANLTADHWQLAAQVADNSDGAKQALSAERPFYALDTRWATGVSLRNETRIDSVYDLGEIVERFKTHEREATAYGGWSAGVHDGWVTRWTGGLTFDERHAADVEDATTPAPRLPADRRLVYPWIGVELVQDDFREERNFNLIGRVEDLALGWQAKLRLGLATQALGSDRDAWVFDGSASKGFGWNGAHTTLLNAAANGRVEKGALADAVFSVAARHYWRQTSRNTLFTGLSLDHGVNLDVDKQLTLGGDNGLRGYPLRYRTGQSRWLFTLEERVFTDWYPFRLFSVGAAAFFDMGGVAGSSLVTAPPPPEPPRKVLRDIGVGLRLGNMRSALGNVVHIDVAHPLDGDPSISRIQVIIQGKRTF